MQKLENEEYNGKGVYKDSDSGRRHVKTTCQVCKKEFFISITTEKREDKGKYCSHSCAAKKGGETKSELVNQEKENNPNWKGGVSEKTCILCGNKIRNKDDLGYSPASSYTRPQPFHKSCKFSRGIVF